MSSVRPARARSPPPASRTFRLRERFSLSVRSYIGSEAVLTRRECGRATGPWLPNANRRWTPWPPHSGWHAQTSLRSTPDRGGGAPEPSFSHRRSELLLTPLELFERWARLVPPPRIRRPRYHGGLQLLCPAWGSTRSSQTPTFGHSPSLNRTSVRGHLPWTPVGVLSPAPPRPRPHGPGALPRLRASGHSLGVGVRSQS
jgi:hypothetical protein